MCVQQLEEAEANIEALRQSEKLAAVRFAQYQRSLGKPGATIPTTDSAEVEQTSAVSPAGAGDVGEFSALGLTKAEQDQIKGSEDALRYAVSAGGLSTASGVAYVFPTARKPGHRLSANTMVAQILGLRSVPSQRSSAS